MTNTKIVHQFLRQEYRDYYGYKALLAVEKDPEFKAILADLVEHEKHDVEFWQPFAPDYIPKPNRLQILSWIIMRKVLGLTFIARYLERNERKAVEDYTTIQKEFDDETAEKIQEIIDHESEHESRLINQIKEERVDFISNIVLGLNDGLIELTGALVGFSFALNNSSIAGASGLITGIAASLSMAASAYLQSRHEADGRDPKKSALYTGGAYLIVVILLIAPYFLLSSLTSSLLVMAGIVILIIAGMSAYSAILFQQSFKKQFGEMFLFSVGTSLIAFALGTLVDTHIL